MLFLFPGFRSSQRQVCMRVLSSQNHPDPVVIQFYKIMKLSTTLPQPLRGLAKTQYPFFLFFRSSFFFLFLHTRFSSTVSNLQPVTTGPYVHYHWTLRRFAKPDVPSLLPRERVRSFPFTESSTASSLLPSRTTHLFVRDYASDQVVSTYCQGIYWMVASHSPTGSLSFQFNKLRSRNIYRHCRLCQLLPLPCLSALAKYQIRYH